MRIEDYLEQVNNSLTTSVIISYQIEFEVKSSSLALIYGEILFKDSSTLEFLELIKESQEGLKRLKYRFQYRREEYLVFRYDNAPHHKVDSFPHHVHKEDQVLSSKEKNLLEVIKEIEDIL